MQVGSCTVHALGYRCLGCSRYGEWRLWQDEPEENIVIRDLPKDTGSHDLRGDALASWPVVGSVSADNR